MEIVGSFAQHGLAFQLSQQQIQSVVFHGVRCNRIKHSQNQQKSGLLQTLFQSKPPSDVLQFQLLVHVTVNESLRLCDASSLQINPNEVIQRLDSVLPLSSPHLADTAFDLRGALTDADDQLRTHHRFMVVQGNILEETLQLNPIPDAQKIRWKFVDLNFAVETRRVRTLWSALKSAQV